MLVDPDSYGEKMKSYTLLLYSFLSNFWFTPLLPKKMTYNRHFTSREIEAYYIHFVVLWKNNFILFTATLLQREEQGNEKDAGGQRRVRSRVRSKGRGRSQYHHNNHVGTPPSSSSTSIEQAKQQPPPPGPRMPDGTRGFAMGRGKPVSVNMTWKPNISTEWNTVRGGVSNHRQKKRMQWCLLMAGFLVGLSNPLHTEMWWFQK